MTRSHASRWSVARAMTEIRRAQGAASRAERAQAPQSEMAKALAVVMRLLGVAECKARGAMRRRCG